ncbi:MAG: DUF1343 domain-containing protein [Verrucomicrobiota bacterium]
MGAGLAEGQLLRRAKVLNGVDVLQRDVFEMLKGKRVGLITNHTGITRDGRSTWELLRGAEAVDLVALFSPEHGIHGTEDSEISSGRDERSGLMIYSLYEASRKKPTKEQLTGIDALVFDIQDIGCRFYTYISTMGLCMEAAEDAGIRFVVLDRVNPIGGNVVDGPVLDGERSFTGFHEIPVRHGMTVGEMARLFKMERFPKLDLQVVPIEGWRREMLFDQTRLPWKNPSPNIRKLEQALLYPGVGLLEFTNLSVGRGTDSPFELVGAPFIDADQFSKALNEFGFRRISVTPARFTPTSSVFKGQSCGGVRLGLKEGAGEESILLGIALARTLHRMYAEEWNETNLNKLLVHPNTKSAILAGKTLAEIKAGWKTDLDAFMARRATVLIYR